MLDAGLLAAQLAQLGRDLTDEIIILARLEEEAVDAEGEYRRLLDESRDREAQEFLDAQGIQKVRESLARLKAIPARLLAHEAWLEWHRAQARLRVQQASLQAIHRRVEVGRSLLSREKALISLAGVGEV